MRERSRCFDWELEDPKRRPLEECALRDEITRWVTELVRTLEPTES